MKYLKLFESYTLDKHTCKECGWQGSIEVSSDPTYVGLNSAQGGFKPFALWKDNVMVCPQCQTENDVWTDVEPLRHKLKAFAAQLFSFK